MYSNNNNKTDHDKKRESSPSASPFAYPMNEQPNLH